MEMAEIMRAFVSLIGVLALILLVAWIAKRLNIEKRFAARKDGRLHVVESISVDAKHKLVIVRRDEKEHVLLVSQSSALLVESYDAKTASH